MNIQEIFFHYLAKRFYHENDLTDVTWALCNASVSFKDLFLKFFFEGIDTGKVSYIQREVPDSKGQGARVDLFIQMTGYDIPYLIEVKIGDGNHHFEQYVEAYGIPAERLGYIANYSIDKENFTVKTWEGLYDYLHEKVSIPMKISDFQSVYSLNVILSSIIKNDTPNYQTIPYNETYNAGAHWCYFEVKYSGFEAVKDRVWPFIGVAYNNNPEKVISAGYEKRKGWGKVVFDLIQKNIGRIATVPCEYCRIDTTPSDAYYFYLSDTAFKDFQEADNIKVQEDILAKFLNEVLLFPIRLVGEEVK